MSVCSLLAIYTRTYSDIYNNYVHIYSYGVQTGNRLTVRILLALPKQTEMSFVAKKGFSERKSITDSN